jgi:tripartite-type tricarboxylate transporter receptor subunit TctC
MKDFKLRGVYIALCALVLFSTGGIAFAQGYPSKPIRIIVGFAPGGATDLMARLIAQKLTESLKQSVVVENHPGAGTSIAINMVSKAAPDGYTLLKSSFSLTINPALYPNQPYDVIKDFEPITRTAAMQMHIATHPSLPVKSVKELIDLAKSKPGKLDYASAGIGSADHLAGELFKSMAGVDIVHVPYKGTAPALNDVLAGIEPIIFEAFPPLLPHIKAGKLRYLAVCGTKRNPLFPEVPTVSESGLPGYEAYTWVGISAPKGTPKEIVTLLNREIVKILDMPDIKEKFAAMGADTAGSTPEEFSAFIQAEVKKWSKVIKDAKIKVEQ